MVKKRIKRDAIPNKSDWSGFESDLDVRYLRGLVFGKSSDRFPQLLLGANLWLPFKRHLIIEEPNWDDKVERYGSVFHLVDEIIEIRAALTDLLPSFVQPSAGKEPDAALRDAWEASSTILRLAQIAAAKHLPLWTTG